MGILNTELQTAHKKVIVNFFELNQISVPLYWWTNIFTFWIINYWEHVPSMFRTRSIKKWNLLVPIWGNSIMLWLYLNIHSLNMEYWLWQALGDLGCKQPRLNFHNWVKIYGDRKRGIMPWNSRVWSSGTLVLIYRYSIVTCQHKEFHCLKENPNESGSVACLRACPLQKEDSNLYPSSYFSAPFPYLLN